MSINTATGATQAIQTFNLAYVVVISSIAALGGLLFGYDWVVIGGAKPFYEPYFNLTSDALVGWANSCALLGCLLGSMSSGILSDRFGRKKLLILSALLFVVSSALTGWAQSFDAFVTWRIVGGIAIGMASNVSPTYISEVSPPAWRGRLVTLNQVAIVLGILSAQIANWLIAQPVPEGATAEMIRMSWNGQSGWRWMFIAVTAPSTAFFLSAWLIPESPRWLVKSGADQRARRILTRIGGTVYGIETLKSIRAGLNAEAHAGTAPRELLRHGMRTILATGIFLAVLQQWAGINVIFSYAEEIYRTAGYGVSGVLFNIVVTGTVNLVFTLFALLWVDQVGRRALMLFGCAGIALSHAALAMAYSTGIHGLPVLLLTLSTIGCFAMSLGPVTWVLISEIFPTRIRGLAVSISVSMLWIACFIVTFTFPTLQRHWGPAGTFWTYAVICFVGFMLILQRVPETKGLTLELIEQHYAQK